MGEALLPVALKGKGTQLRKGQGVHVLGIPELSRALKKFDERALKDLQNGFKSIARGVINIAEGRGAPRGHLKPRATFKGAGIAFNAGGPQNRGTSDGWYPWWEFGGGLATGRGVRARDRVNAYTPLGGRTSVATTTAVRRAVYAKGRWLYPSIADYSETIGDTLGTILERAARREGFEVRG